MKTGNSNISNSLEDAGKNHAEININTLSDYHFETLQDLKECVAEDFIMGANWQKEQYKDIVSSHSELLEALKRIAFVVKCNRATNGISLEIMYETEYLGAIQAIENAKKMQL